MIGALKKRTKVKYLFESVSALAGSAIFSAGIAFFITPGKISVGGFTGISIVINHLFALPVGTLIIVLNIPMFVICARIFGLKFIVKTVIGVVLCSVLIDVFSLLPPFVEEPMVCALFGGLLQGAGLGILYSAGFTTGGSDLVLWLLKLKFPYLRSGFIYFILDSVVVGLAALIFRDIRSVLYSAIAIFTYTKVLDTILGSSDLSNMAFIISGRHAEIGALISKRLGRGATELQGTGWFTGDGRVVLLCVIDRSQLYPLKELIRETDPGAFVVLTDAREVIGCGFKPAGHKGHL